MKSCRSCLILIEDNAPKCPHCGTNPDSQPVAEIVAIERARAAPSMLIRGSLVVLAMVCAIGGLLWFNFREPPVDPAERAAETAADSLVKIRGELSIYALSTKDSYPARFESLGERVREPAEAASAAGYELQYSPAISAQDGVSRGFVLLARPKQAGGVNLYVDETGVVRASSENRAATAQDAPL